MSLFDCPHCGERIDRFPFPLLTVDCIVRDAQGGVLLVRRRYPPPGWALPGGFVDRDETVEQAVARELHEETGLRLRTAVQLHVYSDPARDRRHHVASVIFAGEADGEPRAGDDAAEVGFFSVDALPEPMAFDHAEIIRRHTTRVAPPDA